MRAYVFLLASFALLAAHAFHAPTASAQNYKITLLTVGGTAYVATANPRPINKSECDAKETLRFKIEGLPGNMQTPKYIELWSGENCNLDTRNSTTTSTPCKKLATRTDVPSNFTTLSDFDVSLSKLCDVQGTRNLWFLGVTSEDATGVVNTYGRYSTLKIDTDAPRAPTGVKGGTGETEIPVKWKTAEDEIDHYVLVWDAAASSAPSKAVDAGSTATSDAAVSGDDAGTVPAGPSDCSSAVLMAGDELPADPKKLPTELGGKKLTGKVSSATINGDDLGSKLAAVGVIAVDLAGNASPVSNIACVKVVPTTGFWDKYKANGGKAESGCACSLPGAPIDVAAGWPVGLVLGGLALRGVRARRRRS